MYEPTQIRRKAKAEADALVIMETARFSQTEIALRAEERRLNVQERRQKNVEAITAEAARLLPPVVSEAPVEPDWAARFFAECEDIGNAQMQSVWAKLLAGEVARPNSFSVRTLGIVKNLTTRDAETFNLLCKHSFRNALSGDVYPLVGIPNSKFWDDLGLDFEPFNRLSEAGLISRHALGIRFPNVTEAYFLGDKRSFLVRLEKPGDIKLGDINLTAAGLELSKICEWEISNERFESLVSSYKDPYKAIEIKLTEVDGSWSAEEMTG